MTDRAGIGPRLNAASLDSAFAWLGGGVSGLIFHNLFRDKLQQKLIDMGGGEVAKLGIGMAEYYGLLLAILIGASGFGLISALLETFHGASAGKLLLNLQIRSSDGSKPEISRLVLRALLKHISLVFFLLALLTGIQLYAVSGGLAGAIITVGLFRILGQDKQTLHDRIAETAVYRIKNLTDLRRLSG